MASIVHKGVVYTSGAKGKSAYEQATDGGYHGTEEEINSLLATADTRLSDLETNFSEIAAVLATIVEVTP